LDGVYIFDYGTCQFPIDMLYVSVSRYISSNLFSTILGNSTDVNPA